MAQADWQELTSPALDSTDVPRGVSNAFTRPEGGGSFVFGFRAAGAVVGFAGYAVNLTNFNPIADGKGAIITCAMKRYSGGISYAPMFGLINGLDPITSNGYLFGLSEGTSYQYACMKGAPASGMDVDSVACLRQSTASYTGIGDTAASWHHLRMDVIVNPHNEVVLKFYKNVLTAGTVAGVSGPVTVPQWLPILGMEDYTDDSLGLLSGSLPITGTFRAVFGHYTSNQVGSVSLFDHFTVSRQINP